MIALAKQEIFLEHKRSNYEQYRKFNFGNYVDSCITIMVLTENTGWVLYGCVGELLN